MNRNEKYIQNKFNKACVEYGLLEDGDHILVALSGGKDSLMLTRLLALRSRIFRPRIVVEAAHVIMDNIPYETDRTYLQDFCQELGIKLHILHAHFDESTDARKTKCFLCAWNRRKKLFNFAKDNHFNKIALGHHQDDILTTWLMNITFEGNLSTMLPRLKLEHYPIEIIRPLCLVQESWIRAEAEALGFTGQKVLCPYEEETKRHDTGLILRQIEEMNPEARYSMWRAMSALIHPNSQPAHFPEKPGSSTPEWASATDIT